MSSIQERLQLKRVPLDSWNIREQLCLASAVVRSGDQNWMSVSRALKTVGEPNRPPDWYSQKSCAAQYGDLLENVETPKRKKRSSEGAAETPQESIVSRLTQDRIAEIQKTVAQLTKQHEDVKNELNEVLNPNTSDERIKEIWAKIEATERAKERELARRAASLKERDERRAKAMRTSRGPPSAGPVSPTTRARIKYQWEGRDSLKERDERRTKAMKTSRGPPSAGPVSPTTPTSTAAPPSSPLLTSLLKSSPVVTTPQHIPHPATVVDTISPSVTAPTLSMLLEKTSPQQDSKRAAIERIKTQLVQIEQQFKANPGPPAVASSVDIDDIEIKDEDVYVFRDIELHNLPQVNTAPDKPEEKSPKKEEVQPIEVEIEAINPSQQETKEEESNVEEMQVDVVPVEVETETEVTENVEVKEEVPEAPPPEVESIQISFPEVKFPTPEIKVIENDEPKQIKEEIVEPELPAEEPPVPEEVILEQEEPIVTEVVEEVSITQENPPLPEADPPLPPEVVPPPPEPEVPEVVETRDIPLPPDPVEVPAPEPPLPPEPEVVAPKEEPETEAPAETPEVEVEAAETKPDVEINTEDFKREDDSEDSIPLKQMLRDENQRTREERATEENHTETDDDAPMELSREEEKDGKKKRDYSRKKKSDSRTCSGSESAEASAPESPSTTDHEKEHRLWKKSVMLVYSRLCAHKYASLFLRPISDEEAPGYSTVVKRPMDLTTIRRNIDNGHIRTTAEFQRAVLLMLSNALMYNSSEHSVYSMTKEMHEEAACQLGMLLAAQAHAGLCPPPRRKRASDPRPRHKRL